MTRDMIDRVNLLMMSTRFGWTFQAAVHGSTQALARGVAPSLLFLDVRIHDDAVIPQQIL
jgi:hypothetical protein